MIKWEIEHIISDLEREKHRALDPCLFEAVIEKTTEYVQRKVSDATRICYKCGDEFVALDLLLIAADGRTSHFVYCPKEHATWWEGFRKRMIGVIGGGL